MIISAVPSRRLSRVAAAAPPGGRKKATKQQRQHDFKVQEKDHIVEKNTLKINRMYKSDVGFQIRDNLEEEKEKVWSKVRTCDTTDDQKALLGDSRAHLDDT